MATHRAQTGSIPAETRPMPGTGRLSADAELADAEPAHIVAESRRSQRSLSGSFDQSDKTPRDSKLQVAEKELTWADDEELPGPVVYGFFAPQVAAARKEYISFLCKVTLAVTLLMWASLPAFWGALSSAAQRTGNLRVWYIDRDDSRIGHALWEGITNVTGPTLGWEKIDAAVAGSNEDIIQSVLDHGAWVAVVVEADATLNLALARENGITTYNPASAVTIYYAQARHEVAMGTFLMPILQGTLKSVLTGWATGSAQRYFAEISPGNTANLTALQMLSNAPQTIMPGIDYTMVNLRPYTAPTALAVTLVGNIFLIIFGFLTVMANNHARTFIAGSLNLGSYCAMRVIVPLIIYFPLSLSFTLVSLAFSLPFGGKYSHGAGFMAAWMFSYLGMAATGLSLESMITILTAQLTPFFLFLLLVFNISPVLMPPELQHPVFQYGEGFPIPNLSQAIRDIFFNTQHNPGRNAGVLIAWIFLSIFTLLIFTSITHRRHTKPITAH